VSSAKAAESIMMPFGMGVLDGGAHWHNLAIMIEPSLCVVAMRPYINLL